MSQESALHNELKKHGHSITNARKSIFLALQQIGPCTIADLNAKLGSDIHRASVYRVVQLFEETGIVRRIQIGWKYKLELSDIFSEHHHHAHCLTCQKIITLPANDQLEQLIQLDAGNQGFKMNEHHLEVYGYCMGCQNKKTPDE